MLAWIKLKAGEQATADEIQQFCKGKIAHFKIPHYVRFVDGFPTTLSGKIQKYKIREKEVEERGLQKAGAVRTA